jgi:hypothetical protein
VKSKDGFEAINAKSAV